ncbi:MAG: hypothetical protein GEV08_24340 [Acidimicrobiia bacterium]|nr:hypothetical protein [Acidimicrobiia bacterium]
MERIVVGVDGSASAETALRWAVEEADHHGAAVTAVLAWSYLDQRRGEGSQAFDPTYGPEDARGALRGALAAVGASRPVEEQVVNGLPANALLEVGADADLLVVGARGLGGFKGLLLGSVSERVLEQAPCPVAVVRVPGDHPADGRVVVGVDGSPTSTVALRWAADEARARQVALHVVHAWQVPVLAPAATGQLVGTLEESARSLLESALREAAVGGLEVEGHLPCLGAARAMMNLAGEASLMVVGTRGHGRVGRAVLGSTSRQLAHHAPCPIVVVPAER